MTRSLSQRLERLARDHVPIATTVLLVLLSTIPLYIPGYGMVAANLALMGVFYWSVQRPDLFSYVAAFVIGLLQDFLIGTPPGMTALIYVIVRGLTATPARTLVGKPFVILWLAFWLVALGAAFSVWLISTIWYTTLLDPLPIIFQAALTLALFPFVAWMLVWTQNKLLAAA